MNAKRLKSSLGMKDNFIIETNREINVIKNSAEEKWMKQKEHLEIKYEEAKVIPEENTKKLLLGVKVSYQEKFTIRL